MSDPSVALLLTPVADARLLAAVARAAKIPSVAVPTDVGAVLVLNDAAENVAQGAASQFSESLGDAQLLLLRRGPSEDPAASDIQAMSYVQGTMTDIEAPGLVMANLPEVVERVLLSLSTASEIEGAVATESMSRWSAARIIAAASKQMRTGSGEQ